MSTKENDRWLEQKHEAFEDAVVNGLVGLALAIIEEVTDNGFTEDAKRMAEVLRVSKAGRLKLKEAL